MKTAKLTIVEKWDKGKVVEVREVNIQHTKNKRNEERFGRYNVRQQIPQKVQVQN